MKIIKFLVKTIAICTLVVVIGFVSMMAGVWASFTFGMGTVSKKPWNDVIEQALDIQTDGGVEEAYIETHGGFHGDGLTYIRINFSRTELESILVEKEGWRETPLTENIHTTLYGNEEWRGIKDSCDFLLPEVENGYYYFFDRQSNSFEDEDLRKRPSFNFTFAIYDVETDILYFIKFDT